MSKRENHSHFPLSSLVMCHLFQSYLHLSTFCCIDSPVLTKRRLSSGDILFNATNTVYSSYKKKHTLPENITMLRSVQCGVWIRFRQCLLRASELTQTSLSNIIRHIYSRVQCKSKHSAAADPAASGSCQLDMSTNVPSFQQDTFTVSVCWYLHSKLWIGWMHAALVGKQKLVGKNMDYEGIGSQ